MFRTIIVPLDGSDFGDFALPYAAALAKRTGADVRLVHVHQPVVAIDGIGGIPSYYLFNGYSGYELQEAERIRQTEAERLQRLAEDLSRHGIRVSTHITSGSVADAIISLAKQARDAVILMSTHGRSGIRRMFLGSVADAVVRRSLTPVLLLRPTPEGPPPMEAIDFTRILVPVDGSMFAGSIVEPIISLAGRHPIEVTFFEAVRPKDDTVRVLTPVWPQIESVRRRIGYNDFMGQLIRDLNGNFAAGRSKRVQHADAATAIVEEADAEGYDLIAMATHGRGNPHRRLLGSTADRVMRNTWKPLLLLRPQPMKGPGVGETQTREDRSVTPQLVVWE